MLHIFWLILRRTYTVHVDIDRRYLGPYTAVHPKAAGNPKKGGTRHRNQGNPELPWGRIIAQRKWRWIGHISHRRQVEQKCAGVETENRYQKRHPPEGYIDER